MWELDLFTHTKFFSHTKQFPHFRTDFNFLCSDRPDLFLVGHVFRKRWEWLNQILFKCFSWFVNCFSWSKKSWRMMWSALPGSPMEFELLGSTLFSQFKGNETYTQGRMCGENKLVQTRYTCSNHCRGCWTFRCINHTPVCWWICACTGS